MPKFLKCSRADHKTLPFHQGLMGLRVSVVCVLVSAAFSGSLNVGLLIYR